MIEAFWVWTSGIAETAPLLFGLVVVFTMAGVGLSCALVADLIFVILRIDLGAYKKEYEEGGGLH